MKPLIRFSAETRRIINNTKSPTETMQRLISDHREESERLNLPTSIGYSEISLSFPRVWDGVGPTNIVLIQNVDDKRLVLYTGDEFKSILKKIRDKHLQVVS